MKRFIKWFWDNEPAYVPFEEKPFVQSEWKQIMATTKHRAFQLDAYKWYM
ncbi:hypothetical protein [Pseudalkalibacillus caeni]|nr:hypothetical protein [Pseudalkalibacillus caeni]